MVAEKLKKIGFMKAGDVHVRGMGAGCLLVCEAGVCIDLHKCVGGKKGK